MVDDAAQEQILRRLHDVKQSIARIEALTDGANCKEALLRLSYVKLAIEQIGIYILESCVVECTQDKHVVLGMMEDMTYDLLSLKIRMELLKQLRCIPLITYVALETRGRLKSTKSF